MLCFEGRCPLVLLGLMGRSHVLPQALLLVMPCTLLCACVAAYRMGLSANPTTSRRDCRRRARGGSDLAGEMLSSSFGEEGEEDEAERVLSLWFDGSTTDNHRTKWFAQVCVGVPACCLFLSPSVPQAFLWAGVGHWFG